MLTVIKLFLPALFPSWRFFNVVGPSPRVELSLLDGPEDAGADWRECRPRPARLGPWETLRSFFWNPRWNESLFLVTCAERIVQNAGEHSHREIRRRIRADLLRAGREADDAAPVAPYFRYRLVFVSRDGDRIRRDVVFVSPPCPATDPSER